MGSIRSPTLLVAVFVAGLVVAPVASSVLLGNGAGTNLADVDPADPPMSVSMASDCADQHTRNASGWLVETGIEDGLSITFNQTYAGDSDADVTLNSSPATQRYTLLLTTGENADSEQRAKKQGTPPGDCWSATSVQAAVTLPQNYSTFTVVHNGETVVQVHNTPETMTRVWKLDGRNTTR